MILLSVEFSPWLTTCQASCWRGLSPSPAVQTEEAGGIVQRVLWAAALPP